MLMTKMKNCIHFTACPIFLFVLWEVLSSLLKCDLLCYLILRSISKKKKKKFFIASSDVDKKSFDIASGNCTYSSKNICGFN